MKIDRYLDLLCCMGVCIFANHVIIGTVCMLLHRGKGFKEFKRIPCLNRMYYITSIVTPIIEQY